MRDHRLALLAAPAVVAASLLLAACSPAAARPSPSASTAPSPTSCLDSLSARVTEWGSAAGSRVAAVQLTNGASAPCDVPQVAAFLVDRGGTVVIQGGADDVAPAVHLPAGGSATTEVRVANVCSAEVKTPVTVMLVGEHVSLVAATTGADDAGVPPCVGDPGSAGLIEIQPWQLGRGA